jgi:hypothetical protein
MGCGFERGVFGRMGSRESSMEDLWRGMALQGRVGDGASGVNFIACYSNYGLTMHSNTSPKSRKVHCKKLIAVKMVLSLT